MATPSDPSTALERYTLGQRVYEWCGITVTSATGAWLCARLLAGGPLAVWWLPVALVVGLLGADLVSGIVHWGFDTWGDLDTPIVGQLAIRAFRQHHVDPSVLLGHDFVETNGHNFMLALPLTTGGLCVLPGGDGARFLALCFAAMAVCVALTSQIHKWAHTPRPPRLVALLQRARLILPPAHHEYHHRAPHRQRYCITVGWLDGLFTATGFFERVERVITRATGIDRHRHDEPVP